MLKKLKTKPFVVSSLILLLYAAYFLASFAIKRKPSASPTAITPYSSQIPFQIILFLWLTAVVFILKWKQNVGFAPAKKGSWKFVIFPLVSAIIVLGGMTMVLGGGVGGYMDALGGVGSLLQLVLFFLLVGYTEELMFRGIFFFGVSERTKPIVAALITAVIFGSFHFINLLAGQALNVTISQVLHAVVAGFMYVAIRMITDSLIPIIIFHATWDFLLTTGKIAVGAHTASGGNGIDAVMKTAVETDVGGLTISPLMLAPALLYGTFVMWRWHKRQQSEQNGVI